MNIHIYCDAPGQWAKHVGSYSALINCLESNWIGKTISERIAVLSRIFGLGTTVNLFNLETYIIRRPDFVVMVTDHKEDYHGFTRVAMRFVRNAA